ncbi:hypothetical protein ACLOJK_020365 [Asimina triloba]
MFYSHSFLSRKGPLGAVWIASHLHNRLRKSHVAGTNISASVGNAFFPYDIPIALRLSGHLLLGVARIYSKKVDYLYKDCNDVLTQLKSASASVQVNLPEHASHAPFHSITLPETFELDACEIDGAMHIAEGPDDHIKAYEEITMTAEWSLVLKDSEENLFQTRIQNDALEAMDEDFQTPHPGDSVSVGINDPNASNQAEDSNEKSLVDELPEDVPKIHLYQASIPNTTAEPMDEVACLPITPFLGGNGDERIHDLSTSNQADEFNQRPLREHSPQDLPEIEILRDAVQSFRSGSLPEWLDLGAEIGEQQEPFDRITNKKDGLSPITEGLFLPRREYVPSRSHPLESTAGSVEVPETFDSKLSFGVPEIAMQPSPPAKKQKARAQKRKNLIDYDTLVLLNKLISKQLRDTRNLKRRRQSLPIGRIDVQRSYNSSQGEQMFLEPSVSGMCSELQEIFKKDFLSPKDGLGLRAAESPVNVVGSMETEDIPTNEESFTGLPLSETETQVPHRHLQSPSTKSSCEREIETPQHGEDSISGNLPEFMRSPSLREGFTPSSASILDSVFLSGKSQETTSLQTPELPSIQHGDLESLSAGSVEQTSARDAAQPDIPCMPNSKEDVLASYGFINVQQEAGFGDIFVFLTPMLSKVILLSTTSLALLIS